MSNRQYKAFNPWVEQIEERNIRSWGMRTGQRKKQVGEFSWWRMVRKRSRRQSGRKIPARSFCTTEKAEEKDR